MQFQDKQKQKQNKSKCHTQKIKKSVIVSKKIVTCTIKKSKKMKWEQNYSVLLSYESLICSSKDDNPNSTVHTCSNSCNLSTFLWLLGRQVTHMWHMFGTCYGIFGDRPWWRVPTGRWVHSGGWALISCNNYKVMHLHWIPCPLGLSAGSPHEPFQLHWLLSNARIHRPVMSDPSKSE